MKQTQISTQAYWRVFSISTPMRHGGAQDSAKGELIVGEAASGELWSWDGPPKERGDPGPGSLKHSQQLEGSGPSVLKGSLKPHHNIHYIIPPSEVALSEYTMGIMLG